MNNYQFIYENFESTDPDEIYYRDMLTNFKNNSTDDDLKDLLTTLVDNIYHPTNSFIKQQDRILQSFMVENITGSNFGQFLGYCFSQEHSKKFMCSFFKFNQIY